MIRKSLELKNLPVCFGMTQNLDIDLWVASDPVVLRESRKSH